MNKSKIFVIGQFIFGIYLLVTTSFSKINVLLGFFIALGFVTVLWATISMRKSVLKVTPDVDKHAKLIEEGPYKWIRHPMYSGVLFAFIGFLFTQITFIRLLAYVFLAINLILKLNYEEGLLEKHFENYGQYKKKTSRLIPFLY
jgi:protein-S-isoprenylcysteine O-methyltransferase Ste14